jgi:sugar O-acyltransferase (sialic acid O-acetyltransferase NeuD family)
MASKVKRQSVVVVGGGGHARVLLGVLARLKQFKVLGYVDPRDHGPLLGFKRLGDDSALTKHAKARGTAAVIGLGKMKAGMERLELANHLREQGFKLPVIISPAAVVANDAKIGEGTVVLDGAVIQPGCVVGRAGIVNSNTFLGHDCTLGDDVHVAPAATLSGAVSVGDGAYVGVNATVVGPTHVMAGASVANGSVVEGGSR